MLLEDNAIWMNWFQELEPWEASPAWRWHTLHRWVDIVRVSLTHSPIPAEKTSNWIHLNNFSYNCGMASTLMLDHIRSFTRKWHVPSLPTLFGWTKWKGNKIQAKGVEELGQNRLAKVLPLVHPGDFQLKIVVNSLWSLLIWRKHGHALIHYNILYTYRQ